MPEHVALTCFFCRQKVAPEDLHYHHLVAIADGGDVAGETVPCHAACHNTWHRDNGDYSRWKSMDYAEKVATFGAEEVRRILSSYGRKGYLKATNGNAREWHRSGGRARAANGRDSCGRFVPTRRPAPAGGPDRLLEAF